MSYHAQVCWCSSESHNKAQLLLFPYYIHSVHQSGRKIPLKTRLTKSTCHQIPQSEQTKDVGWSSVCSVFGRYKMRVKFLMEKSKEEWDFEVFKSGLMRYLVFRNVKPCCLMRHTVQGHRKMDGIWNRFKLKSTSRITFEQGIISRVIFMQDAAPRHFSCFVTDVFNERFPDAWIGRGGPIPWPPRSPDLSPLDFCLWGFH